MVEELVVEMVVERQAASIIERYQHSQSGMGLHKLSSENEGPFASKNSHMNEVLV